MFLSGGVEGGGTVVVVGSRRDGLGGMRDKWSRDREGFVFSSKSSVEFDFCFGLMSAIAR